MGAGHPRLRFELDTFTVTQPAHFTVDADYRQRKGAPNHAVTWAVGQVAAVDALLDGLADANRNHDGLFPELVFFDCHACHHPMSERRWQPRAGTGVGPGVPALADANLIMLGVILDVLEPDLAGEFRERVLALHQASTKNSAALVAAANALKTTTQDVTKRIQAAAPNGAQMSALADGIIDHAARGDYQNYAAAEQATMALSSLIDAMKDAGTLSPAQVKTAVKALDPCYAAVAKDEAYVPSAFTAAVQNVRAVLPRG
jgi:hypothetical protein